MKYHWSKKTDKISSYNDDNFVVFHFSYTSREEKAKQNNHKLFNDCKEIKTQPQVSNRNYIKHKRMYLVLGS